jgi:hypothetical protein
MKFSVILVTFNPRSEVRLPQLLSADLRGTEARVSPTLVTR